jgi:hypothetical protein
MGYGCVLSSIMTCISRNVEHLSSMFNNQHRYHGPNCSWCRSNNRTITYENKHYIYKHPIGTDLHICEKKTIRRVLTIVGNDIDREKGRVFSDFLSTHYHFNDRKLIRMSTSVYKNSQLINHVINWFIRDIKRGNLLFFVFIGNTSDLESLLSIKLHHNTNNKFIYRILYEKLISKINEGVHLSIIIDCVRKQSLTDIRVVCNNGSGYICTAKDVGSITVKSKKNKPTFVLLISIGRDKKPGNLLSNIIKYTKRKRLRISIDDLIYNLEHCSLMSQHQSEKLYVVSSFDIEKYEYFFGISNTLQSIT